MLSVIIVDYRSINKTIEYIKELHESIVDVQKIHFVIVDNAYEVDTPAKIEKLTGVKYYRRTTKAGIPVYIYSLNDYLIIYCTSQENLGYAKGNNLGAFVAEDLFQDEILLISNNDLKFNQPISLKRIRDLYMEKPDVAVIGPRVIGLDSKPQSPHKKVGAFDALVKYYWAAATGFRLFKDSSDLDYTGTSKYCYRVMGCFMFVKSKAFFDCNGFDTNTFMYAEESILSEKLNKIGLKTYFMDEIEVIHAHGESVKSAAATETSLRWSFESVRYYFKEYRNLNIALEKYANLNFEIYILYYTTKERIKRLFKF